MIYFLLTLLLLPAGCARQQVATTDTTAKTITVCELFQQLDSYRGKIVSVRGVYRDGLGQEDCREKFVTGGHEWPTVLFLVDSDFTREGEAPVPFITDHKSWDALELIDQRESRQGGRVDIYVTIVGQLLARKRYVPDNGDVVGGYGDHSVFLAELVVKTVKDIDVRPKLD